jgi:hypothetical protein
LKISISILGLVVVMLFCVKIYCFDDFNSVKLLLLRTALGHLDKPHEAEAAALQQRKTSLVNELQFGISQHPLIFLKSGMSSYLPCI